MKTVLVFGTFDRLHPGHDFFLNEAKKHGDRLVVVVGRDHNVFKVKNHLPTQNEQARLAAIQHHPAVDEARLGLENYSKKGDIIGLIKPNIICLGYDQAPGFQSPDPKIKVVRLPAFHPEQYKSSLLP